MGLFSLTVASACQCVNNSILRPHPSVQLAFLQTKIEKLIKNLKVAYFHSNTISYKNLRRLTWLF